MINALSWVLLGIAMLSQCDTACAQAAPSSVNILVEFMGNDRHFNSMVDTLNTFVYDTIDVTVLTMLPQGGSPSVIHLQLGTHEGFSDLLNKEFVYDGEGSIQDGTTYRRNGDAVYLGAGSFTGIAKIYAQVKLVYPSGNFSEAVSVSTN